MKKWLGLTLSFFMAVTCLPTTIKANEAGGDVTVTKENGNVTIGNDYLTRTFSQNTGLTTSIYNSRIARAFAPGQGSENFVIRTLNTAGTTEDEDKIVNEPTYSYTEALSTEGWSATLTNGTGTAFSETEVAKLFDNNLNTNVDNWQISGFPFNLDIDFGKEQTIAGMSVNKRPGYSDSAYGINGTMGGYEIWTSADGKEYTKVTEGEFTEEDYNLHQEGNLYNVGDMVWVNFDEAVTTQYVRVVQTSVALGTAQEFTSAEVDFYATPVEKTMDVVIPTQPLDRTNWTATIQNASGAVFGEAHVAKLFDNNLNTHPDEYTKSGNPITVDIDLGAKQTVRSLSIDKRPGYSDANYGTNGTMGEFELYVSKDGAKWELAGAGNFTKEAYNLHQEGNLYNVGDRVYANFHKPYTTRYVRLVQKTCSMGSAQEFTSAEFNLYEDQYTGYNWNTPIQPVSKNDILSSELTVEEITTENITGGKGVRISYAPYEINGVTWNIDMVTVMENGKHYMNSYLEISVSDSVKAQIDYIDFDAFVLPEDVTGVWSIPAEKDTSSMWIGKHELMLGQPIYANGLFFGSEFPVQETDINDETNTMQIRYYSGKNFVRMGQDNQLQEDGSYRTWNNVVGAARGTDTAVVQTDFFDYIEDIATPTDFRKQYNSWYDNMMNITDESIANSFNGSEKGLAQNGVEPLDSYVVDDGWNNYYDGTYTGPGSSQGSGTPNQTGFWEFNNKFPNELYTSSSLVNKFNSTFGVWVGPQGGYNFFGGFADFLASKGTGEVQNDFWKNICTGSRLYLNNFEKMAIDYQTRFNVTYWKWDGFAVRPCTNADHHHMTGGYKNMYYTSDMWEAWTDLFENVRKVTPELFINATCYVNLSPWLLQWVNTIWIQDSGDTGQAGDTNAARHQQKIYYRDNVYYNLYKTNQIQFPLKNIYNHDPIYGVSDGSDATDEVFREFLMDNAMRGTAFWELYYSPSIMNDAKWKITADALAFAEENHDVLKNAKLFVAEGHTPTNGVYGYSAWNSTKGFVSFVNPTATEQTYTLSLTDVNGVPTTMANFAKAQVYPYAASTDGTSVNYGDEFTVTLAPFSSQIYQFGIDDITAPSIVSAKITDTNKVQVKFSERMSTNTTVTINGKEVTGTLLDDYRTFEFTVEGLEDSATVTANALDVYGNTSRLTATARTNVIASQSYYSKVNELTDNGIAGTTDFGISMAVKTTDTDTVLLSQGNDITLSIDSNGYVVFNVLGQQVSSKEDVTTVIEKAHGTFGTDEYVPTSTQTTTIGKVNDGQTHTINAVREPNGVIKLYIDGRLSASTYNENKANENISKGTITLGSTSFDGTIADVLVENNAVYFDEAKEYASNYVSEDYTLIDREGWTAEACSQQTDQVGTGSDGSAMDVLDGKDNTYWHSNWSGKDTCGSEGKNHWIKVNFGKLTSFDSLEYTARPGASNGTWQNVTVYGIDENGNEVEILKDQAISLTNNRFQFIFDETQTYTGVKFVINESVGGFGSAAEIKAYEKFVDQSSKLAELKQQAQELFDSVKEENYTPETYAAFKEAVDTILGYNDLKPISAAEYNQLKDALEKAYANLVLKTADYSKVNEALAEAEKVDRTLYTEESLAQLDAAIKAVVEGLDITQQATVDAMAKAITDAIANLEIKTDKSGLEEAIKEAEKLNEKDYTEESWADFEKALEEAQKVLANENATQEEIDHILDALEEAIKGLVETTPWTDLEPSTPVETDKPEDGSTDTSDSSNIFMYGTAALVAAIALILTYLKKTNHLN